MYLSEYTATIKQIAETRTIISTPGKSILISIPNGGSHEPR